MKISVEITGYREPETELPCEVEIYFDSESIKYFVNELNKLREPGDHFHWMTNTWGLGDLSEEKVREENSIAHHLKITLI